MGSTSDLARYRSNFIDEVDSAYLYRVAALLTEDETLSGVYERLAETEERHASLCGEKPEMRVAQCPDRRPQKRTRMLASGQSR